MAPWSASLRRLHHSSAPARRSMDPPFKVGADQILSSAFCQFTRAIIDGQLEVT